MFKKIKFNLPNNPTVDEKTAAIELLLEQFIDKKGNFNTNEFSKNFYEIQKLINDNLPDWQTVLNESPLYADDILSQKFIDVLSKTNPKPADFADLGHSVNVKDDADEGVKQFSSVPMNTNVPPLNEELIIYHPGYLCCVQGIVDGISETFAHVKNLSIGGDFIVPVSNIKWLPADRFNPVKTTENTTVTVKTVKGFSKPKAKSRLATLIEGYIGEE